MPLKRPTGEALAEALHDRVGYRFRDLTLLQTALTHSSAARAETDDERPSIPRRPGAEPGRGRDAVRAVPRRARRRPGAALQRAGGHARTCNNVGLELELDAFIRGAAALKAHKGGQPRSYLSDAVEALIAAIYLDGGMEPARAFILRYWQPRSSTVVEKPRNPKSELQEWLAQQGGLRPEYVIDGREGPDHDPTFTVSVVVPGFETMNATGRSRRAAEEAVATAFLLREGVWHAQGAAA